MRRKTFIIYAVLITLTSCRQETDNSFQKSSILKTTEQQLAENKDKSIFSTDKLNGTSWIVDNRKYYDRFQIFTETDYTCISIIKDTTYLHKSKDETTHNIKRTSTFKYKYYLSVYKPSKFDYSKVGTNTKGDYLVSINNNGQMTVDELIWISPNKLVLVQDGNDTVYFTKKEFIRK